VLVRESVPTRSAPTECNPFTVQCRTTRSATIG